MATAYQFEQKRTEAAPFAQRHYTTVEIAALWNISDDTVRRLFEAEAGVLAIGNEKSSGRKRRYVTLRIPEGVLRRVHRRLGRI